MALNEIVSIIGSGLQEHRRRNSGKPFPGGLSVYVTNWEDESLVRAIWASGFSVPSGAATRLPPRPVLSGNLDFRRELWIYNDDNTNTLYIGQSGVTPTNGFPLPTGQKIKLLVASNMDVFGVSPGNSVQVKTLEIA